MVESSRPSLRIDLNEFKLHLYLKNKSQLTLHFNSPSRRFYLSVIALLVHEMKKAGRIKAIPLQEHFDLIALLNESVGGAVGSSEKANLLHRIYVKWKDALPNLEEAPLFKVLGRKKEEGDGGSGRIYPFTDAEKDGWANLFEYTGSHVNVRLKFAIDKIGVGLDEASILWGEFSNGEAWSQFVSSLEKDGKKEESPPAEETPVPEPLAVPLPSAQEQKISRFFGYRWAALVVVIGVLAAGVWKLFLSSPSMTVASVERMKYPLPDEPSIAVLPFVNLSDDPKQEILCDGITEDIITALAKAPRLFVIARNSTFTYKGKPVKVQQVSEDLGVRYVLEGSLQRSGDRIRINIQLIDALKGNHVDSERYDRDLKDLFALQDEITLRILTATRVKLTDGEQASMTEKSYEKYLHNKQGLDCYLKYLEARKYYERGNFEDVKAARRIAEGAVAMCPELADPYVGLGFILLLEYWMDPEKSPQQSLEEGIEMTQKAIARNDSIADAHALLAHFYAFQREYDKAIAEGQRAIALSPGSSTAHEF